MKKAPIKRVRKPWRERFSLRPAEMASNELQQNLELSIGWRKNYDLYTATTFDNGKDAIEFVTLLEQTFDDFVAGESKHDENRVGFIVYARFKTVNNAAKKLKKRAKK